MTAERKHQLRHVLDSLNLLLATRLQVPYGSRGWWKLNNACAYLGWAYVPELIPQRVSAKGSKSEERTGNRGRSAEESGRPLKNLWP